MSRAQHSEAEIIAALKQVDAGRKVEDVAREVGVTKHPPRAESNVRRHGKRNGHAGWRTRTSVEEASADRDDS